MSNSSSTTGNPTQPSKANLFSMIFHARKTAALTNAVLHDARVHWLPKLTFVLAIGVMLLALLFPELGVEALFLAIPGIGPVLDVLGIPADAGLDWVAFSVAAFNLLKLFPAEVIGEHYDRLFRSSH